MIRFISFVHVQKTNISHAQKPKFLYAQKTNILHAQKTNFLHVQKTNQRMLRQFQIRFQTSSTKPTLS